MSTQEQPSMMHNAMNLGAVVGLYYIGKFCLFPLSLHSTLAAMLFLVLTMMVPLLVYRLTRLYRDRYAGGSITFPYALGFVVVMMACGSLLAAVGHYIYFAHIDGGAMVGALEESIGQLSAIDLGTLEGAGDTETTAVQLDEYIGLMRTTMVQIKTMSPIAMTMGMLSNNISWSLVVALPVALLVSMRRKAGTL